MHKPSIDKIKLSCQTLLVMHLAEPILEYWPRAKLDLAVVLGVSAFSLHLKVLVTESRRACGFVTSGPGTFHWL
jgi:hypothetical protein